MIYIKGYQHFLSDKGLDKKKEGVGYGFIFNELERIEKKTNHGSNVKRCRVVKKEYPNRIELKIFQDTDFIVGQSSQKKASPKQSECNELVKGEAEKNKILNTNRSKQRFMDLIETNITGQCYFWTYTFKQDIKDLSEANYQFNKFIKRLKYQLDKPIKYVAVPELQKKYDRNVWHYHVIFFDIGRVDWSKMGSIWGLGYVYVKRIEQNNGLAIAHYMSKYLTKASDVTHGKKKYFASRNLDRPKKTWHNIDDAIIKLFETYDFIERASLNDYLGYIRYYSFDLKKS